MTSTIGNSGFFSESGDTSDVEPSEGGMKVIGIQGTLINGAPTASQVLVYDPVTMTLSWVQASAVTGLIVVYDSQNVQNSITINGNAAFIVPYGYTLTFPASGTVAMGAGSSSATSANSAASNNHTHAVTSSSAPGVSQVLLASDTSGRLNIILMDNDGWVSSSDTWTYVSATSFKISGVNRTTTYTTGTRIKCTNSTVKYFVVTSSTFSTDTTVNVTGGSDYSLANTTISANYYSYAESPAGYPDWFNYTPTLTGFSADPTATYRFKVDGRTCSMATRASALGTSNATGYTITAPITAATITNHGWIQPAAVADNGASVATPGRVFILSAQTAFTVNKDYAGAAFTNANGKGATFIIVYEI